MIFVCPLINSTILRMPFVDLKVEKVRQKLLPFNIRKKIA